MASSVIHTKSLQLPPHLHYSLLSSSSSVLSISSPHLCLLVANSQQPFELLLSYCFLCSLLVSFNLTTVHAKAMSSWSGKDSIETPGKLHFFSYFCLAWNFIIRFCGAIWNVEYKNLYDQGCALRNGCNTVKWSFKLRCTAWDWRSGSRFSDKVKLIPHTVKWKINKRVSWFIIIC